MVVRSLEDVKRLSLLIFERFADAAGWPVARRVRVQHTTNRTHNCMRTN